MSGKRKAEGIALLSLYNDDEDMDVDDDDDDLDDNAPLSPPVRTPASQPPPVPDEKSPSRSRSPATPLELERPNKTSLGIVDYAHDETAMSPEPEEGEILSGGQALFGQEGGSQERTPPGMVRLLTPGKVLTPQPGSQADASKPESDTQSGDSISTKEPEAALVSNLDGETKVEVQEVEQDPLADFLPPPPTSKCSEELQNKINKYLALKSAGRSFNEELRNSKGYRNPDFLQRAVRYQEIDQIGSCFSKDIFDPHGYDPSDYYDALALELKREIERREQEKKKSQRVDFVHGGTQPGSVQPVSKPAVQLIGGQKGASVPVVGGATISASVSSLHSVTAVGDAVKVDNRQNKKSKWDKVDGDRRNPLPMGAQDAMAAASAHAALLSAANAGAGYTAFAQQKRKEAEEKRSSEKRSEKKS